MHRLLLDQHTLPSGKPNCWIKCCIESCLVEKDTLFPPLCTVGWN